jgi:chaperonin GroEL
MSLAMISPEPRATSEVVARPSRLRAAKALKELKTENEDQKIGINIVRKVLSWRARLIAINAGEDGSVVVGKILDRETYNFGYNAQSGEYGDLTSQGVIDPTKVVRCALQDAASIAGLLITTESMAAEKDLSEAGLCTEDHVV